MRHSGLAGVSKHEQRATPKKFTSLGRRGARCSENGRSTPEVVVQTRLGHARVSTTIDLYTDALPELGEMAAHLLDAVPEASEEAASGTEG